MSTARAMRDRRVSEAEFLALPESMEHVELVDGEVIVSPAPGIRHQVVVLELAAALRGWAEAHRPAFVGLSPLDVRIAPGRIVQPDLFVLRGGLPAGAQAPIDVVPDLAIEVLSSRPSHDRLAKRTLYAECGVREYWIVDPDQAHVEVVCGYEVIAVERHGLSARTLPDLTIDLPALFARMP